MNSRTSSLLLIVKVGLLVLATNSNAQSNLKIRELQPADFQWQGPLNSSVIANDSYSIIPTLGLENSVDGISTGVAGVQPDPATGVVNMPVFDGQPDVIGTDFSDLAGNETANLVVVDECLDVLFLESQSGRYVLKLTVSVQATGVANQWDTLVNDHRDPLDLDVDGVTGKGPDGIYGTDDDVIEPDGFVDTGDGIFDAGFPLDPAIQIPFDANGNGDPNDDPPHSIVNSGLFIGFSGSAPIPFEPEAGLISVISATWELLDAGGNPADLDGDGQGDGPFDVTAFQVFNPVLGIGWSGDFGVAFNNDGLPCSTQESARGNVVTNQLRVVFRSDITPAPSLLCTQPSITGDTNRDGFVNLLDVASFVECVLSGGFIDGEFFAESDVNEDRVVNLKDVSSFVQLLTGS